MKQNRKEILLQIAQLAVNRESLTPEQAKKIKQHSRIDELMNVFDALDLEMEIEKHFGISVGIDEEVKTFGEWVDLVIAKSK